MQESESRVIVHLTHRGCGKESPAILTGYCAACEIESLREQNAALQVEVERLTTENTVLRRQAENLIDERDLLQLRFNGLAEVNKSAAEEVRELREQLRVMQEPVSEAELLANVDQEIGLVEQDFDRIIAARSAKAKEEK